MVGIIGSQNTTLVFMYNETIILVVTRYTMVKCILQRCDTDPSIPDTVDI